MSYNHFSEHYYIYNQLSNNFIDLLKILGPAILTFFSGFIGLKYGIKLFKIQKRTDFVEKQLNNLYGPLLALHKTIESIGLIRLKISKTGDEIAKEKSEHYNPEDFKKFEQDITKEIEYNNKKLEDEILPLYNKMLSVFTDNLYLADEETKKYLIDFSEFVEIWDRWQKKAIMAEVIKKINHTEDKLKPFYEHLDKKTAELKDIISFEKSKRQSKFFS